MSIPPTDVIAGGLRVHAGGYRVEEVRAGPRVRPGEPIGEDVQPPDLRFWGKRRVLRWDRGAAVRLHDTAGVPDLYREFAELDGGNEAAVLAFANRYGLLGELVSVVSDVQHEGVGRFQGTISVGEPVEAWEAETARVREAVRLWKLWGMALDGDPAAIAGLGEAITPAPGGWAYRAPDALGPWVSSRAVPLGDGYPAKMRGDVRAAAAGIVHTGEPHDPFKG